MNTLKIIHALRLDGEGGAHEIDFEAPIVDPIWIHFDYTCKKTVNWIKEKFQLDPVVISALENEETRPRCIRLFDSLLISLRGINVNPGEEVDDMVAIRVFASKSLIITSTHRKMASVNDLAEVLQQKNGPCDCGDFIIYLSQFVISRMSSIIDELDDQLADLEDKIIHNYTSEMRPELNEIRHRSISLRRYITPQREALLHLSTDSGKILNDYQHLQLREVSDQCIRYIEDLDSIRDRSALIREEFVNRLSEQLNHRMYILSLAAAIFLPLGFLTGLLGINVGGIPGSENPNAFTIFLILLSVISAGIVIFLRTRKWF